MKSDINDLCEAFLAALTNAGYAVKSIENYKQVSNRFKKFCAENGYDTYTVNIGQIFADNVFNEETGAFVGYRNVMYSLVVGTAAKMARETCNAVPENVHCHLFRKTKAIDLYKNGIPLPFIMQLLGHESMSTTSGFYAFATLEMMSDAINKSVPIIGGTEKLWKNKNAKQALYTLD